MPRARLRGLQPHAPPTLQATGVHKDQPRATRKSPAEHFIMQRQQCLAGVERFEWNTALRFAAGDKLQQLRIGFGEEIGRASCRERVF